MRKKLIGTAVAAVLILAQATSIFALGSKTSTPIVGGDSQGKYEVVVSNDDDEKDENGNVLTADERIEKREAKDREIFKAAEEKAPAVFENIVKINKMINELVLKADEAKKEEIKLDALVEVADKMTEEAKAEVKEKLENKELLTKFIELAPIDGGIKDDDGKYVVTLSLPVLTDELKDKGVNILHFSLERELWEVIEPENIDFEEKEITAKFEDLSPIAFVADKEDKEAAK